MNNLLEIQKKRFLNESKKVFIEKVNKQNPEQKVRYPNSFTDHQEPVGKYNRSQQVTVSSVFVTLPKDSWDTCNTLKQFSDSRCLSLSPHGQSFDGKEVKVLLLSSERRGWRVGTGSRKGINLLLRYGRKTYTHTRPSPPQTRCLSKKVKKGVKVGVRGEEGRENGRQKVRVSENPEVECPVGEEQGLGETCGPDTKGDETITCRRVDERQKVFRQFYKRVTTGVRSESPKSSVENQFSEIIVKLPQKPLSLLFEYTSQTVELGFKIS